MNSSSQEHRTAECSLRVSRSLQPRGRWARSGKNASGRSGAGSSGASRFGKREHFADQAVPSALPDSVEEQRALGGRWQFPGSQHVAGGAPRCARDSRVDDRELFACAAASPGGSLVSSGAGCAALLDGDSRAVPIDLPGHDHVSGYAGRQGVEQPAPGMRRGFRPLTGALSQARKMHRRAIESLNTSFVPHSRFFSLHPSLVSQNSSLSHGLGATNSCGFMHGLCMHDNSLVMHDNSWGALEHNNSCSLHAAGVRGGTKAPSTSTRTRGWRSAVEKLASPQQTSSKLHVEVWEGLLSNQGMIFSPEQEIVTGCFISGARPSCLDGSPEPPGPGRVIRNMFGWSQLEKTARSGYGCFGMPSEGRIFFLPSAQQETGSEKGRTTQRGRSLVIPRVLVRTRTGEAPAIGPHSGRRCWPLLAGVWRAIAPLMKPWCAEGEVPTAANLNLYRGWKSCVGWHCDDEPLFGKCGDAKLIVSVSFGSSALFRWRRQSCSDDEGHLCWLGHGDVLVMDGQCQDEFLHCTDPGLEQERINVTFRWVRQRAASCPLFKAGVACCLPTCAQGSSGPVMGNVGSGVFWVFWLLFSVLCMWRVLALLVDPLLCTRLGSRWCASCWTRPLVGGRWEHCLCDLWEDCLAAHKPAKYFSGTKDSFMRGKPYMLALVGQPVSMVIMHMWFIGIKGHFDKLQAKVW